MKRNDLNDLRTKTVDELKKMLADLREEVAKVSIEELKAKGKNVNLARIKKKDIARVLTILHMKAASVESDSTTASQGEVQENG